MLGRSSIVVFSSLLFVVAAMLPLTVLAQQENGAVSIIVVDAKNKPLPAVQVSVNAGENAWFGGVTDEKGVATVWLQMGTAAISLRDMLGKELKTDKTQLTFSKPGESQTVSVLDARIVDLRVIEEGGGTPYIVGVLRSDYPTVMWGTISTEGKIAFTMHNSPALFYVGSPLRKTERISVPNGGDYSATVTLRRTAGISASLAKNGVTLVVNWNNPDDRDIGLSVPYALIATLTTTTGLRQTTKVGTFELTPDTGSKKWTFPIQAEYQDATLTASIYMDLAYSYNDQQLWDKVRAHANPWVEVVGIKEAPRYQTGLLTSTTSLEAAVLKEKYGELSGQYQVAQKKVSSLEEERTVLQKELTSAQNQVSAMQGEKSSLQEKASSLENEKAAFEAQLSQARLLYGGMGAAAGLVALSVVLVKGRRKQNSEAGFKY